MGSTGAIAALQLGSAYSESQAEIQQGKYQKTMLDINSRFADLQAQDAIKRGDKQAQRYNRQVSQMIGQQRAGYASQGVDVSSGTALSVQQDTGDIGAEDVMTIRNNAWREAWGFKAEAINSSSKGRMARIGSRFRSGNTLITGGLQAAQTINGAR